MWIDRTERYVFWRFGPSFCSELLPTGQGSVMREALAMLSVSSVGRH
jgi:hypothetical protein